MGELLGSMYGWFESLFGQHLGDYLWGYNCETQAYDNRNLFTQTGLAAIAISLVFVLVYYYLINHPRFNRGWHWCLVLLVSSLLNFFIAGGRVVSDFTNGRIGDCLMYARDANGKIVSQLIYKSDCWMFGVANAFVAALFFILFSFIFKWWSRNCKHVPIF